jgi:hypothetical protein
VFTEIAQQDKVQRVHQNAVILANVIELVCACVKQAATSDVAQALGDDSLNRDVLANLVANRIKEKLIA